MSSIEIGFLAIAVVIAIGSYLLARLAGAFHRDAIYVGLTPGLTPPRSVEATTARVKGGREYTGEVAVAFSPPRGLGPGLVGTVVDSVAEMRDVTATIVDLAVRGHLTIRAMDETKSKPKKSSGHAKAKDWELTRAATPPADQLNPMEAHLFQSLFAAAPVTTMSAWTRTSAPRELMEDLYRQSVANGWYQKDPRRTGGFLAFVIGFLGVVFAVFVLLAHQSVWTLLAAAVIAVSSIWAGLRWRGRVARTAEGTAAHIQALGFKKYLATAEAEQFSFEEAAGIFSRYLPYAIVFGVAEHWSKVFGDVVERSGAEVGDDLIEGLFWFDISGLDTLAAWSLFSDGDGFGFLGLMDSGLDLGGIGDVAGGLGDFAEGVGDFISGIDFDF